MIDLGDGVKLVTRSEWGAQRPLYVTRFTGVFGSTSHWEGPHMGPFPHSSCASKVRGIQKFHMQARGWADIAYSYLVCPHGYVFEGRGIGLRTAANGTNRGNQTAYAVCYLGGQGDGFTTAGRRGMRSAADRCRNHGAGPGRNSHRDWKQTECPGDAIATWVRAGQPVSAAPPAPTPTPTPDPQSEDVDMYMLKLKGKPAHCLVGAGYWKNLGQSEIDTQKRNGIKVAREVDQVEWDRTKTTALTGLAAGPAGAHDVLSWYAQADDDPLEQILADALAKALDRRASAPPAPG